MQKQRVGCIGWLYDIDEEYGSTTAVCDINRSLVDRFTAKREGVEGYTDYREMAASGGVDVVMIATPNEFHREMAECFLRAGVHVFLEKPMGVNREEMDAVLRAQQAGGVELGIDFELRVSFLGRHVRQLLADGTIGTPVSVEFIHHRGAWLGAGNGVWRTDPKRSGGLYFMEVCHEVDLFRHWFGEIQAVQSHAFPTVLPQYRNRMPDNITTRLWFESGVQGMIHTSHTASVHGAKSEEYGDQGHDMYFILAGTEGALRIDCINHKILVCRYGEFHPDLDEGLRVESRKNSTKGYPVNDQRKVKIAQVGVGHFGGFRRNTIRETGVFDLVAAYDINPKALAQAEQQDGARPAGSYEELLETEGIEAMVISTGAKFHAEQAIAAMEKGLHVFVEKPLCSTKAEMDELLAVQKKTGVIVTVGHNNHRRDPVATFIKQAIDAGTLGDISHFEKVSGHAGGWCIKPGDWRGDPEKNPGGMLFQCGVHSIHELMYYFGPVKTVSATMRYDVNPNTKTADIAMCQFEFESGLIGSLNSCHVAPYRHYFNVYGTKRNLYREDLCFDEGTKVWLQTFTEHGAKEPWEETAVPGYDATQKKAHSGNVPGFYDAIVNGGPSPYPTLLDGARAVAAVFAADEAAKSGTPVSIDLPTA